MNSKAIRKQLLAAVAMVLVAAVALGSSTYAWFVASGTVTATGMKVQAESESGLAIRFGTGSWGTTASAGMDSDEIAAKKLKPTSTADSKVWSHASAETPAAFGAKKSTRKTLQSSEYNAYFLKKEFQIRSTSATAQAKGLYVQSVTVTGVTADTMNTALRVGVAFNKADNTDFVNANSTTVTSDAFVIFAPVVTTSSEENANNSPTYTYTFYKDSNDTGTSVTALAANAGSETASKLISGDAVIPEGTDAAIKVQVYVWYEGEDQNLYSDNYVAQNLSVSVNFSSIGEVTP